MINGDILNIEPSEIKFPFELKKEISCTLHLSNISESNVDYKVFSTNPKKYWVQPKNGVILPRSTCDIVVYMYEQNEAPLDMLCTDMFMIRSTVASRSPEPGEVGPEMLAKDSRLVFEHKLKVVYVPPHHQCSSRNMRSKTFTSRQSSTEEEEQSGYEVTRAVSDIKDKLSETCLGKLLKIVPSQLELLFELNKEMSCSLQLTNITKHDVAFKMKTTNPRQYSVRPKMGIVLPGATFHITVRMQAQKEAPPNMLCKDKFVLQSVVAVPGVTIADMNPEMFKKSAGYDVEDYIFPVVFLDPSLSVPPVEELEGFLEASSMKHENSSGSEVIETLSSNQDDSLKKSASFRDGEMSIGDLLTVKPSELIFPFKFHKRFSCFLHLTNKTESHVAFKVRAKNPEKYTVQPSAGFILPQSKFDVIVTLLPQKRAPPDFQIQETFLLQCLGAANPGSLYTSKDAIRELFTKEAAYVKECKLRVVYMPLAEPQLPFSEGSRESSAEAGELNQVLEEFAESSSVAASGEQNEQSICPSEASEEKNEQSNVSEANVKPDDNGRPVNGWAIFCAVVVLLGVLYSSLNGNMMIKMLPVMMKTAMEMVSDMVGDWVVKALVVVCFQLIFGYQYMHNN